ncbi:Heat shock protein FtsJ/RrmJ [Desulfovibrio sp. DV]|uniref:RlmE family RNA methyltransferase n=1 Tax=Desulfovibrio sp. DV TaxID=1844708 RepID=UPI00094BB8D4|nr:RlmE family RNA methyltransferase [Desulfovibrio sp. DV]OLN30554.1 Heat shock protein FtsJ/RrmJ [Desulfovibrio sp. DV]
MKTYRDHYFNKAKQENYPARSVYKLKEIEKQSRLLVPGAAVLDLGACPGSWSLYAAERVGPQGRVLAIDLKPAGTAFSGNVTYLTGDMLDPGPDILEAFAKYGPFDVVLSDMAPNTIGHKFTDQARSFELCEAALSVAVARLKPGGSFVVKIFQGPDFQAYQKGLRLYFSKVRVAKPKSSRPESKEIFFVATGFHAPVGQPDDPAPSPLPPGEATAAD